MRQSRLLARRSRPARGAWPPLESPGAGIAVAAAVALACAPAAARADAPAPPNGPAVAPEPAFDVEAYDVDGASLIGEGEIETAVDPYLGPGQTRETVEKARAALEKVYRDKGFQSVVVEIPPQSVADTVIRLHVIEAPIGRLRVTGSRYYDLARLKGEFPSLKEGQVANFTATQTELSDANRLADRQVSPVVRAGVAPGTVDVDLKVSDTLPLHASVELDNDHSADTTPLRLNATIHYDNLWQLGHSASFTYAVAPEDPAQQQVFAGSYLAPLWSTPWSLLAYGYDSNSNVATLGGVDVLGKGYVVGVRGVDQLPRLGDFSQSLSLGIDFKHFDQNVFVAGQKTVAPIEYWPLAASWTLTRQDNHGDLKVTTSLTANIRGLGGNTFEFQYARQFARPNFLHLNLDIAATQNLWRGMQLAERFSGQVSDYGLVSSEQFAAGGLTSVRGYLQAEAIGDQGFTGGVEVRSPVLATYIPYVGRSFQDLRLYAFADGGVVNVIAPLQDQTEEFDLASTGLGLRLQLLRYLKGELAVAVPLIDGSQTRAYRPRATFSVKSEF